MIKKKSYDYSKLIDIGKFQNCQKMLVLLLSERVNQMILRAWNQRYKYFISPPTKSTDTKRLKDHQGYQSGSGFTVKTEWSEHIDTDYEYSSR